MLIDQREDYKRLDRHLENISGERSEIDFLKRVAQQLPEKVIKEIYCSERQG